VNLAVAFFGNSDKFYHVESSIVKRLFICLVIIVVLLIVLLSLTAASRRADRNERYRPGDWVSFGVARYISSVAVGPDYTYFGSSEGLLRYDIFRNRWEAPYTVSDGLANNQILAVAYDIATGFLWCSTPDGVSSMHPSSYRWTNYSKGNIGISPVDEILSIGVGRQFVWFETRSRRLFNVNKLGSIIVAVSDTTNDNIFWFGVRAQRPPLLPQFFVPAGYVFDPNGVFQDFRLRRADVTGFVRDKWDSYWLGTWGLGAWKANVHIQRAELLSFGLAQRRIDALAFDERGLWIGGRNDRLQDGADAEIRGITYWRNPSTISVGASEWKYHEARYNLEMSSDEVNRFEIAEGKIYCATEDGINIYDSKKDRWRRIISTDRLLSVRVNDVAVHNGYLWAATEAGLNRIKLSTIGKDTLEVKTILPDVLLRNAIYDLERTENLLWMATDNGPIIYDMAEGSGGYMTHGYGPRGTPILAISHSDSVIWFGTEYDVEAFDMKNKVWLGTPARQRFPKEINGNINYLLAQPEALWVGTDAGVFKYNRQRQDWRQFTTEDGLIDNRVNAIAVQNDWIWFGTPSGLTAFRWNDPHRID
jgi:ligand-binding sensor domain-containing protein